MKNINKAAKVAIHNKKNIYTGRYLDTLVVWKAFCVDVFDYKIINVSVRALM